MQRLAPWLLAPLLLAGAPAEGGRKLLHPNGLEPIENVKGTPFYDWSRAVARLEDAGTDGRGGYSFCSGAKIGDDLFITNYHCDHPCDSLVFHLGYEKDMPADQQQTWRCAKLLAKNITYDYAVYEATLDTGDPNAYPSLVLYTGPVHDQQPVVLPSHPEGDFKQIDRTALCVLSSTTVIHTNSGRDTIEHMCDTEGGSSGAPVLDRAKGYAVGLHWGGVADQYNYAILMSLIVPDLQANLPPDAFAKLQVVDQ